MTTRSQVYTQLELIGRELFGKAGRLTLGMYCGLHVDKDVTWTEYHAYCRQNDWPSVNTFKPDIERFEKLGMVTRVQSPAGYRQKWWHVEQHELWNTFLAPIVAARLQTIGLQAFFGPKPKPDLAKVREDLLDVERRLRGDA